MNLGLAVEVHNLTIKFGDFTAVKNVSFDVARGEIFGFLGANGAGKTTTIRTLCGLLEPTDGYVRVEGSDYGHGADAIKKQVGYMSQKFTLYNDLTIDENIAFIASLRKLSPAFVAERKKTLFDFIGFHEREQGLVRDLPGGLKQELSLVAALLHDPDIIFLDEPTAGVAPAARAQFWKLISQLSHLKKTVFVTTHYMDEAEECHRIALLRGGELIACGTPAALKIQAFPDLLIEVDSLTNDQTWRPAFKNHSGVLDLQPYGRRFHAIVKDASVLETLQGAYKSQVRLRVIAPSLEDVFIRLVEGANR